MMKKIKNGMATGLGLAGTWYSDVQGERLVLRQAGSIITGQWFFNDDPQPLPIDGCMLDEKRFFFSIRSPGYAVDDRWGEVTGDTMRANSRAIFNPSSATPTVAPLFETVYVRRSTPDPMPVDVPKRLTAKQVSALGFHLSPQGTNLLGVSRPGYPGDRIERKQVDLWLANAKVAGIKTILCLLDEQHLQMYVHLHPDGLLGLYRAAGFRVIHRPVKDHVAPPIPTKIQKTIVWDYLRAEKPLLVHCSAGIDRTGCAIKAITSAVFDLSRGGIRISAVTDTLFAANRPAYGHGAVNPKAVAQWLAAAKSVGIKTMICLLEDDDLSLYASLHPAGLLGVYRDAGFQVIHHPMQADSHSPMWSETLDEIACDFRKVPKPVLIHGDAGIVRTGCVLAHLEKLTAGEPA
jgi:protein-tyrosine phosphatase